MRELAFIYLKRKRAGCTPVVYAFRHAEDFGTNLTLVGRQHADLYPSMVASFEAAHNYCPVGYVYSLYNFNPDAQPGTNNPLESTAIFWTSQGLHDLGKAIAPGTDIPIKTDTYSPPRNAAYVFVFNGSGFEPIAQDDINKYVQCFDVRIKVGCTPGSPPSPPTLEGPPTVTTVETRYWCGNGVDGTGNLPATSDLTPKCEQTLPSTFNNLGLLKGKICDTSSLIATGPRGYYGYCQ